jgi:hypothetical protein
MRNIARTYVILGIALGCSRAAPKDEPQKPQAEEAPSAPDQLLTFRDGTSMKGGPGKIDIYFTGVGSPAQVDVTVWGQAGTTRWVLQGRTTDVALLGDTSMDLPIARMLQNGMTTVQRFAGTGMEGIENASAGTARLSWDLADKKLSGEVKAAGASLDATFQGKFVVTCSVPPSMLENMPGATGIQPEGRGLITVVDQNLESPFCRRFAHLR